MIIQFAIRMRVAFEKISSAQFLFTMETGEMFRMPRFTESSDHLTDNRFFARVTTSFLRSGYTLTIHVLLKSTKHRIQLSSGRLLAVLFYVADRWIRFRVRRWNGSNAIHGMFFRIRNLPQNTHKEDKQMRKLAANL